MDTIIMSSKKIQTSEPNRLLLDHVDKINLKRSDKYVALSNISMNYIWKNIKRIKTINLRYHGQR